MSLLSEPPNKRGLPVEGIDGIIYTGTDPMKQEPSITSRKLSVE